MLTEPLQALHSPGMPQALAVANRKLMSPVNCYLVAAAGCAAVSMAQEAPALAQTKQLASNCLCMHASYQEGTSWGRGGNEVTINEGGRQ